MKPNEFEIISFPLSKYGELSLDHRDANRQLTQLQRITALGMLANHEAISTAQYTMSRFDEELQRLAERIRSEEFLTPYQRYRLHQATLTCMVRLGQNAVQLSDQLTEILLR